MDSVQETEVPQQNKKIKIINKTEPTNPMDPPDPTDSNECKICIENFTKIKSRVMCNKCNFECCKHCVQEYLLTQTMMEEPHCMNCKEVWNDEFLYEHLNKTFINSTYRKSYKNRLFNIEQSRIPETMVLVTNYKRSRQLKEENKIINENIKSLKLQIRNLEEQRNVNNDNIYYYDRGENPANQAQKQENEKRQFIHRCPTENCKGFLSSAWKCNICENWACSKCFESLGDTKDANHTCQENNLKSAQLIKKETHPCPKCAVPIFKISGCDQMWCTQCTIAFSWKTGKISTGTVHNPHYYQYIRQGGHAPRNPGDVVCGGLNNYWDFTRNLRNIQPMLYNLERFQNLFEQEKYKDYCKELIIPKEFQNNTNNTNNTNKNDLIIYENIKNPNSELTKGIYNIIKIFGIYHRAVGHNFHGVINVLRQENQNINNNNVYRIKYILNEISEQRFKTIIGKNARKASKNTRILHVLELFNTVMTETLNNVMVLCEEIREKIINKNIVSKKNLGFINEKTKQIIPENVKKIHHYLNELFNNKKRCIHIASYCNKELKKIGDQYNTKHFKIDLETMII